MNVLRVIGIPSSPSAELKLRKAHDEVDQSSDFFVHRCIIEREAGGVPAVVGIQVVDQDAACRRVDLEWTEYLQKLLHRLFRSLFCERLQLLMEDPQAR